MCQALLKPRNTNMLSKLHLTVYRALSVWQALSLAWADPLSTLTELVFSPWGPKRRQIQNQLVD